MVPQVGILPWQSPREQTRPQTRCSLTRDLWSAALILRRSRATADTFYKKQHYPKTARIIVTEHQHLYGIAKVVALSFLRYSGASICSSVGGNHPFQVL